ncbi:hypothetical protein [Proteiniphilum sp. X52]|uniref:alpha-1,3-galactosidase-related protein n=1 Tax=Proteiniphilum sp. X52 TaxID=2382159 RepID=UPI000F0A2984|nr:hypothetical protein [Proteiniphilum sp. X52]RNC63658.1 hypothetical protein D7D25_15230 [Proteiniphilum sp. X52]
MKKILGLIMCVCVTLAVSCTRKQAVVVKIPLDGRNDYTSIVWETLQQNKTGNLILEFEKGVYHFYPEKAKGMYVRVSNNDNGYKKIAFHLNEMKNVEIRGNGTEFMFYGSIVPFYINRCSEVSVSGISIDYNTSFILEGKVMANDPVNKSIDIKLREDINYEIKDKRLFYKGYDWSQPLGQNIVFDPATNAPYYYTSKYLHHEWKGQLLAEELGEQTVRLSGFAATEVPPVGSIYIDKGPYRSNRLVPGIILHSSSDVRFSDMNIYMAGAMALIGENTENVTMNRFNVRLREGSGRYISASADATHFVNCRGTIHFEDCVFENMLDDATNVHGTYMVVDENISDDCIFLRFGHVQQEGFLFASVGDTLQLVDRKSLLPVHRFVVKDVKMIDDNFWVIRSAQPFPQMDKSVRLSVENLTNTADVVMRRCTVRNNRARSILLSTPKPVLIEDNYFDSMMAGILIAGDANSWFESGNVTDVVIRNNTFVNMGKGGEVPQSVLQISPEIPKSERTKGCYHGRILFEDNLIKTFDVQVVYALSVDKLIIRNNEFIQTHQYKPIFNGLPFIDLQNCNSVAIEGNSFVGDREMEISSFQCGDVYLEEQAGFKKEIVNKPNIFFYQQ